MATKKVLPAKITARWLKSKGACHESVSTFTRLWPRGITRVTARDVRLAVANEMFVWWLVAFVCNNTPITDTCRCGADIADYAGTAAYLRNHQKVPRA